MCMYMLAKIELWPMGLMCERDVRHMLLKVLGRDISSPKKLSAYRPKVP